MQNIKRTGYFSISANIIYSRKLSKVELYFIKLKAKTNVRNQTPFPKKLYVIVKQMILLYSIESFRE
ncbi:hypothetical protein EGI22_04890 [Lacihabitans sp. LS3-19]|nr:hypothetical protein [Lacihabitans sp. LS3-19]